MPWFVHDGEEELPIGIPRSMDADLGVRSMNEDRSWVGLDMAALSIAGECLSMGESIPPSTLPSSFQMAVPLCRFWLSLLS